MAEPAYEEARRALRAFVEERDWDRFHRPKDLALSASLEAAELLELFQWRDPDAEALTAEDRARIAEEAADVAMYCMLLADKVGFSLPDAILRKLEANRAKYPAEKARGRSDKYNRL